MNQRSVRAACKVLLFAACLPLCAAAQTPAPPATPALPPYVSPEVHGGWRRNPSPAGPECAEGYRGPRRQVTPLQQDADGLWTVTTPVLAPEIYAYRFVVDGQPMLDPRNTDVRNNLLNVTDNLTIPGTPPEPWEVQSIPHGVVEHHFYTSQIVLGLPNNQSDYYVYTPPGYSPKARQKYPVLYLLHGFSDAADGWSSVGKANFILDSLIASGKARPMIVVMTLGYGNMAVLKGVRNPELSAQSYDLYQKALLTEVMPQIEANYHVSKKREDRAIAGLSMGGHESLFVGLAHPELFAWIGTFSAGLNAKSVADLPATNAQKANLRLLWMACGVDDAGLLKPNQTVIMPRSRPKGLPVTAIETPGHHQWPVWRDNLVHFAPASCFRSSGRRLLFVLRLSGLRNTLFAFRTNEFYPRCAVRG
jgi:enterochelin esterase-like enzyme